MTVRRAAARFRLLASVALVAWAAALVLPAAAGQYKVYTTYLWHLQQPIYWPEKVAGQNRYQFAYDSLSGSPTYPGHPQNNLADIFGLDDRKAAYQFRPRDAVSSMTGPDSGAQMSYAGSLIEDVWSLGQNQSLGYGPTWYSWTREAMGWRTTRNERRLEPVGFAYHHAFMPLIDPDARRKEIAINREIWWKAWGGNPDKSNHPKGFRCSEEAFSERIIKDLVDAGYQWVIVPNHHLSRTHPNYVQLHGKGLYDRPNKADQINNPNSGTWYSGEIDGRGSTESVPFSFQAHRAKYVDPTSGQESVIIVVPMTDLGSYRDGYSAQGIDLLNLLNGQASQSQPCLALFSHDGDNAWGGGFSYYQEAVPNFTSQASGAGYRPTTIQTFLDENPPPANDIVHVEDGAWFNAENDWGHPLFVNWLWPPQRNRSSPSYNSQDPSTYADIAGGWAEDFRNWGVIMAAQNVVSTADQMHRLAGQTVEDWKIQEPVQHNGTDNGANAAELAWHFFLGSLDSGYMYYGAAVDMEVKPTLACNQAVVYARQITSAHPAGDDLTPPTVFNPQRYPWNPGSTNYGAITGYRTWVAPSDFHIWTLAYDLSGITSIVLRVRADLDGSNPLGNNENETYAGGSSVGAWQTLPMTRRDGSTFVSNIFNSAEINFFIMPTVMADEYWSQVTGYNNQLLDYYIEAADARGNIRRTDIQHVFVGSDGGGPAVTFAPQSPRDCDDVTTTYNSTGRPLAGASPVSMVTSYNGWASSNVTVMAALGGDRWVATNTIASGTAVLRVLFRNAAGTVLDSNGGGGWSVAVSACTTNTAPLVTFQPAAPDGCNPVTIRYEPGTGPLAAATNVFIHVGRNAWQDVQTPDAPMENHGTYWSYTYQPQAGTVQLNCVFRDGGSVWDNNGGRDWTVAVANCGSGTGNGVRVEPGSAAIADDPAGQNAPGVDRFSLRQDGGDALTVDQGGFGSFGHVYLNDDATNLYVGAVGASVGGDNNAMILFMALSTLGDNAPTLWNLSGAPQGLDHLHNVQFSPGMDLAIVLGNEFGDGTYPSFNLGDGYDFGQGVFYLSTGTGTFVPVAGAKLAQFDGTGTNVVVTADDDGDARTDRWMCAIPWGSLNATGMGSIASCTIAGLIVNSSTNGPDRYISGNYLGTTATNSGLRDGANYGFSFVTLNGLPVTLPGGDRDGDGLPDDWEARFFGNATNGVASADDDGDLFTNVQEYWLGTDPRSSSSALRITGHSRSNGQGRVTWQSIGDRAYIVERSSNLLEGASGFQSVTNVREQDVPAGIGDTESVEAAEPAKDVLFYRIRLAP